MARTRAQDYDAKRQTILHRSAGLFAEHGYSATSVTMIAKACGVSKALLYHYYPDKMAVLFDILFKHLNELIAAVEDAARATAAGDERLRILSGALLEAYRDADAQHQVQIASLKFLGDEQQDKLRVLERRLVAIFADAIAVTVPEIGRGPLLEPLTMSLFGMLNWHCLWFRDGKGLSRQQYAAMASQLVATGAAAAAAAVALPAETLPPRRTAAGRRGA